MEEQPGHGYNSTTPTMPSETNDHKVTDFMGKKEDRSHQDVAMLDLDVQDKHEDMELKEKHTLLEELQRAHSNSSSSSDEEVEEGGEGKKRKKKGLKDKKKEKISREEEEERSTTRQKDTCIAMENCKDKLENEEATNSEEKKGFLDKIIEKLPGQNKKTEEGTAPNPANHEDSSGGEMKEKKGILDKIKEKLPGHHKNEDEVKDKQN